MKIVFFGASKFVIPIIETLRKHFDLSLILTTEQNSTDAVTAYCIKNKIEFVSVSDFSDPTIRYTLNAKRCELGVLAYFGLILPEEILSLFPKGILNIHPSLLPKYRGPTPGQTAILDNEKETGITLIRLDEEVDHGPILDWVKEKILLSDTAETLYSRLFAIGAKLLKKKIKDYLNNKITLHQQDHSKATFTQTFTRQSGYIDLFRPPLPDQLDRMIRAYYPWPGVWTKWKIRGATLGVDIQKIIKFLPEKRIQVEGKKPMSYKDFLNGYKKAKQLLEQLGLQK